MKIFSYLCDVIKRKIKECKRCQKPSVIFGQGLCSFCYRIVNSRALKRTPIKKRSRKYTKHVKEYSSLRQQYLLDNPCCAVRLPNCSYGDTDQLTIHHMKGRGKYFLDTSTWLTVCMSCHRYVEDHPEQAKANGWSRSRLD